MSYFLCVLAAGPISLGRQSIGCLEPSGHYGLITEAKCRPSQLVHLRHISFLPELGQRVYGRAFENNRHETSLEVRLGLSASIMITEWQRRFLKIFS